MSRTMGILTVLSLLALSPTVLSQSTNHLTNGMLRADVIQLIGQPKGSFAYGPDETLLYSNGKVTLHNGKVKAFDLISHQHGDSRQRLAEQPLKEEAAAQVPPPQVPKALSQSQQPGTAEGIPIISWQTDFKKALSDAAQSHRNILLDFTGSDWCHFCIKLDAEVLNTPEFKTFAESKFVCVKLDFPRQQQQNADLKKQNSELAKKFAVRGYPTIIILSPEGELIGRQTGYMGNGKEEYIEHLKTMITDYEKDQVIK